MDEGRSCTEGVMGARIAPKEGCVTTNFFFLFFSFLFFSRNLWGFRVFLPLLSSSPAIKPCSQIAREGHGIDQKCKPYE